MAQCKECYEHPGCEYLKHPTNEKLLPEDYHNCQEFNGILVGYRIHRTGGHYPEGQTIISKLTPPS